MSFFDAAALTLNAGWRALTNIVYPGTGLSFASILIGACCAVISLRIIGYLLSLHFDMGGLNVKSFKPYSRGYDDGD